MLSQNISSKEKSIVYIIYNIFLDRQFLREIFGFDEYLIFNEKFRFLKTNIGV